MFPKAPDQHKPNKPLVPNGLGVFYVLFSVIYLLFLQYFNVYAEQALTLATCILFGGFMGLFDDWINLKWRFKAFLPLFAALPLAVLRQGTPIMATYFWGKIDFREINIYGIPGEIIFLFVIIPLIVTVTTNTVNQLGGLNGLETICPLIVMLGLFLVSIRIRPDLYILLYASIISCLVLALFNFQGKIFVGNTGSFAAGITLASYAIIANIEQTLLISMLPFIFNSSLILINALFLGKRPSLKVEGSTLKAGHRRSLATLIAYYLPVTERKLVLIISSLLILSTLAAVMVAVK